MTPARDGEETFSIAERRATLEQQREDIKVTLSELEAAEGAAKKRLKELRGGR
jgi:hypothetical protein